MRLIQDGSTLREQLADGSEVDTPTDVVQSSHKMRELHPAADRSATREAPPGWAESWLHLLFLAIQGSFEGSDEQIVSMRRAAIDLDLGACANFCAFNSPA